MARRDPQTIQQQPSPQAAQAGGKSTLFSKPVKTKSNGKPKTRANGKSVRGVQSKYDDKYAAIAEVLMRTHGFTEAELAGALKTTVPTLTKWKKENPDLLLAINEGKARFDNTRVREALRSRALGYKYTESETGYTEKQGDYEKTFHKSLAPDVTACIFWLVNRQPDDWKHVARTIIQGDAKNPVQHAYKLDLSQLPDKELEKIESIIANARAEKKDGQATDRQGPSGTA